MTAISDDIRKALRERGVWREFLRRRDELRLNGVTGYSSNRQVLADLAPDLVETLRKRGRPPKAGGKPPAPPAAVESVEPVAEEKPVVAVKAVDEPKPTASIVKRKTVGRDTFKGKTCSLPAAFMWAYSNLCIDGVEPSEAPSAVAWQMYVDMRDSAVLKADMLRAGLSTAMRKAELDTDDGTKMDGQGEYDINAAIVAATEASA